MLSQRPERTEVTVSGKIIDIETKQPLEYATISFISKKENNVVTGGITDINGKFSISVLQGMYSIKIEYMSFKTQTLPNRRIIKNENLGIISLEIDIEALGEVEVIAERTTVEIKLDKKIYNVGKDLTVRGGTVSDVLDNVPSVSVDVEGNVALRGNDNVTILINGKPSGLVGLNSTDALRQLPAESIEKVEVITSPSARYDAEGTAGILNIILRRSKLQGLNGAITAFAGYDPSAGISGNINYRTGDFNFFNTTGYSYRERPGESIIKTNYFDGASLIEKRESERIRKGLTTNLGVEWYINDSASLTTSMVYRDSNNESTDITTLSGFAADNGPINSLRIDPELEDDKTIQYSVNFDKQFNGNSQHKLTADFQWENSREDENSNISDDNFANERVQTLEDQEKILLKTDYVLPIGKDTQFELGYRGSFNTLETDYIVEDNETGVYLLNTDVSNNLLYKEYTNALYTQFGSKIKSKFSYLLGLRMENSRITIDQLTSNDYNKKHYTEFFPTVNLGYELSENQSFTLGYNRRIRRPRSRFINPFPSRSSRTSSFQGNPDLDPSYSNKIDLGYLNKMGKLTLNSSIYYERATSVFTFITETTGETVSIGGADVSVIRRTPINLATNDRFGFEFTTSYRPSKKWFVNANFNLFQSEIKGDYNDISYDSKNVSWFARLNNKYTLPGKVDWQTQLFYMGPRENAQNKRKSMMFSSMAFSKDLFKEKASLTLSIRDLFSSAKHAMESTTTTYTSDAEFRRSGRTYNLAFTYRFNQKKKRSRGRGENGDSGGDEMGFD